jgi:hypothetical protein
VQLRAAEFYSQKTGKTFGFGAALDGAVGFGPGKINIGVGGSGSTMIVADRLGNSGILNSFSAGPAGFKGSGSKLFGGGFATGIALLYSPNTIDALKGGSYSFQAAGGALLGGGVSVTTSKAYTFTFGIGFGAEVGGAAQFGPSVFIPFCR